MAFYGTDLQDLQAYDTKCSLPHGNDRRTSGAALTLSGLVSPLWLSVFGKSCTFPFLDQRKFVRRDGEGLSSLISWLTLRGLLVFSNFPEAILVAGVKELVITRQHLKALHRAVPGTRSSWTLTHMFYVDMGGLVTMRGDEQWPLHWTHIQKAIEIKALTEVPPVTSDEIMDKSKTDYVAKAIAIAQLLYFYINFFARISEGLPVSLLELEVAGIATFSLVAYACYFCKPRVVRTPTVVFLYDIQGSASGERDKEIFGDGRPFKSSELWDFEKAPLALAVMPFTIGAIALGAIHLAAWNIHFLNAADMWI